jgi:hypothetical protein
MAAGSPAPRCSRALWGIVNDTGSTAPQHDRPPWSRGVAEAAVTPSWLDLAEAVAELLAIAGYVTADDGPLQPSPDPPGRLSPWHVRLLVKALERLEAMDTDLRSRVVFLVAGKDRGYRASEGELERTGAALDACRATTSVVDGLLSGRLPTEREFEAMSMTVLRVYPEAGGGGTGRTLRE